MMAWCLWACLGAEPARPLPVGKSAVEIRIGDVPLEVFTYRPQNYTDGPLILVFHGILRNADEYRDHAINMGDRYRALIAAPKFDEPRFPKEKYQFGNIVNGGQATPPGERTGAIIPRLVAEIRRREGRAELPYYLIGHSGGGQFLYRLAAFVETDAREIVAANPGSLLFPRRDWTFPYGYGGLPEELASDEQMRKFLAQRLTVYVGDKDTERDEYLDVSPGAELQGPTRWDRNQRAFRAWQRLAQEKGWPFGWRLVVAQGVEHDHEKMFDHDTCTVALFGRQAAETGR